MSIYVCYYIEFICKLIGIFIYEFFTKLKPAKLKCIIVCMSLRILDFPYTTQLINKLS